jgi:OOP family OmpA-OmpF porin
MPRLNRLVLAGVAIGVVAGCTYDPTLLDQTDTLLYEVPPVRVMAPQGPEFGQGLREGYLLTSDSMGGDFGDKNHFAFKAVDSAKGNFVLPDTVESRWLSSARAEELAAARARLMAALDQTARDKVPWQAAKAQTAFDCWLEQAEWSSDENLSCKEAFEKAIVEVERALTTEGNVYLVFFAWDQVDLTPVTMAVLDQIAADYATGQPARLVIAGHADRSGAEPYNQQLSERRAGAVASALVQRGLPQEAMDVKGLGESQPRIPTEDGVREPQNRRVEIVFGDAGPSV